MTKDQGDSFDLSVDQIKERLVSIATKHTEITKLCAILPSIVALIDTITNFKIIAENNRHLIIELTNRLLTQGILDKPQIDAIESKVTEQIRAKTKTTTKRRRKR